MSKLPPRHFVFSSRTAKTYLCIVAANDTRHAMHVARQMFCLGRGAYAVLVK